MTDLEIIKQVNDWYSENYHMFKTDEYYGIDIVCELYKLVNKCVFDGDDIDSIVLRKNNGESSISEDVRVASIVAEDDK